MDTGSDVLSITDHIKIFSDSMKGHVRALLPLNYIAELEENGLGLRTARPALQCLRLEGGGLIDNGEVNRFKRPSI